MSLAAWMPSSLRFFSICLLRARAARSSADEAQPMAMARTAWLATRGSAVLLACSRLVVAKVRARARSRTRSTRSEVRRAPRHDHARTFSWIGSRWHRGVGPRTNDGSRTPVTLCLLRKLASQLRLAHSMPPDTLITPSIELTAPTSLFSPEFN